MSVYKEPAETLWNRAGKAQIAPAGAAEPGTEREWLLKSESRVRILLSRPGPDGVRVVSKIYRTPARLAWRTLFMTSRAKREYFNLVYAHRQGLCVVRPLGWGDTRSLGCVRFNQLSMAYVHGRNLIEYIGQAGLEQQTRDHVIQLTGELLASLHRAGIAWGTALPRNVMVSDPGSGRQHAAVAAFDFPYAYCSGRDIRGSIYALTDLWWMADDWLTRDGFDNRLLDLFYAAYAGNSGQDPAQLRLRVESITRLQRRLHRYRVRIVQAFRLNRATRDQRE